jgi:hypothetical protein
MHILVHLHIVIELVPEEITGLMGDMYLKSWLSLLRLTTIIALYVMNCLQTNVLEKYSQKYGEFDPNEINLLDFDEMKVDKESCEHFNMFNHLGKQ